MIQNYDVALGNLKNLYLKLKEEFPDLIIEKVDQKPDFEIRIPKQIGLDPEITLYIDNNDEFFIWIGNFCASWFPCDEIEKFKEFEKAITSYLYGKARIVETYRGDTYFQGEFQLFQDSSWITNMTHSILFPSLLFWRAKSTKILKATEKAKEGTN